MQGYFGIKITPLGANMVLMEEQEEGELQALHDDAKDWLAQWFSLNHGNPVVSITKG
ncbi:hypothetical protein A2U01_0102407, partial [Trifolium medium]|nr:hypothetical protein [Trifolium medium]